MSATADTAPKRALPTAEEGEDDTLEGRGRVRRVKPECWGEVGVERHDGDEVVMGELMRTRKTTHRREEGGSRHEGGGEAVANDAVF